jgi:SAM-dependent methyltransferase
MTTRAGDDREDEAGGDRHNVEDYLVLEVERVEDRQHPLHREDDAESDIQCEAETSEPTPRIMATAGSVRRRHEPGRDRAPALLTTGARRIRSSAIAEAVGSGRCRAVCPMPAVRFQAGAGGPCSDLAPRLGTTDSSAAGHRIGSLAAPGGAPTIGTVTSSRTFAMAADDQRRCSSDPRSPYRLGIHGQPTFSPADYGLGDTRKLGAQVAVTSFCSVAAYVGCMSHWMAEQRSTEPEALIDVEELAESLRERVEHERAAGRYTEDVASLGPEPIKETAPQITRAPDASPTDRPRRVVYRPEVGYSSRRLVGPILTAAKRLFYRLFFYPLDDLARQTNDAVEKSHAAIAIERAARESDVQAVIGRVDTLVNQLELADRMIAQLEGEAREAVQRDVQSLAIRLDELEATYERLQLPSRLARLERLSRSAPKPAPSSVAPSRTDHQPPSFDYMTFENRFRPEKTVRERHGDYVELLRTCQRVVDLGCGRGELLELLRDAGVSAYGVELDSDVVAVCQEKGLEVLEGDAVSHVEALKEGVVDGLIASHVIEHLTPDLLLRLITAAAEKLAADGIVILETPNPESLLAGSINFHRDPTHVRPVHPDTLSFLCESAGFSEVEIRRLAPVPADVRLPKHLPDESPLSQHVGEIVEQLDQLIYGYQDYALIARL